MNKKLRILTVTLNLAVALGFSAAILVPGMTAEDPTAETGEYWYGTVTQAQDREDFNKANPAAVSWTKADAKRFAGCEQFDPEVLAELIVVRHDSTREPMSFDETLERNTNEDRADDVWPIGTCKR